MGGSSCSKPTWGEVVDDLAKRVIDIAVAKGGLVAASAITITATLTKVLWKFYVENGEPDLTAPDYYNYATAGEFPYHASIHRNDGHYCSGAFIGSYFILTVAEAMYAFVNNIAEISKLKVYVGIREIPSHSLYDYAVDKITIHPSFQAHKLAYNMAVLKLKEKVTEPRFVAPIAIPSPKMNLVNLKVIVSGFRNIKTPYVQCEMTKSQMIIIPEEICKANFRKIIYTSLKFCVIPAYRWKPCQTTWGGTAVNTDKILMGLYVFPNPISCSDDLPEIFVDVSKFVDFIRRAIE